MHRQNNITEKTKKFIAENFRNTDLGLVRIAKNLGLQDMPVSDLIRHCRKIILSSSISEIEIRGKNYYLYSEEHSAVLTINRSSLGIITAKRYPYQ
ncbi:MAG: DUF3781 domain-containing protein [Hyphomicrobiales bacterium]|nr:DUF3781 domain-containing protein [Hyphomicrobiales bacterium]